MPTNNEETLLERYQREHMRRLDSLSTMSPRQIYDLELQLHNALAHRDALLVALEGLMMHHAIPSSVCVDRMAWENARTAIQQVRSKE